MAGRATRSASRAALRAEAAEATGPLGALSHDELGVVVDGLADPLQPVVAVALSSTCLGLRTPLKAALMVLKERHARALPMCRKVFGRRGCERMRDADTVFLGNQPLTMDEMVAFGMILRTNGLPRMSYFALVHIGIFGLPGVKELCEGPLCEGLRCGSAPALTTLDLAGIELGPAGAEALAAALSRGAMPTIEKLQLSQNPIGNQGVAALTTPVRKLSRLKRLQLVDCDIGDEGVASLVADLGKDDFKALKALSLHSNNEYQRADGGNKITDVGVAKLVTCIDAGGLPNLMGFDEYERYGFLYGNPVSATAARSLKDALDKRSR